VTAVSIVRLFPHFLLRREVPRRQPPDRTDVDHVERNTPGDAFHVLGGGPGWVVPSGNAFDETEILIGLENYDTDTAIANIVHAPRNGYVQEIARCEAPAYPATLGMEACRDRR